MFFNWKKVKKCNINAWLTLPACSIASTHKAEQNVTMLALRSPRFVRYQNSELADLPYITKQYLAHNWQRLPLHH